MAEEQEIIYRIRVVGDDEGKSKLASLESQLAAVGTQRAELIKKARQGQELDKLENEQLKVLNAQYQTLTKQKRDYNSEVNRSIKQASAEVNSLAAMRANISQMRAEYEKLAPASEKGKALAASIGQLQKEINDADFATKNFRGNVGNYMEAAQMAVKATEMSYRELKAEIKALQSVSFAGKTDEEIRSINTRVGELKGAMDDLRATQEALDVEMGSLIAGSMQVGTAAVEGFVGTLNVLGIESEVFGDLQKKMVDLIGVTQALGVIEEALARKTLITTAARIKATVATTAATVANWANVTSTTAQANATAAMAVITGQATIGAKAAAAAQWLWNAAILANPIVAIVAAVAALTAGIVYLASSQSEATLKAESLRNEISRLNEERKKSEASMDYERRYAEALGATTAEMLKLEAAQNAVRMASLLMEQQRISQIIRTSARTREDFTRYQEINTQIRAMQQDNSILYAKLRKTEADEQAKANEEQLKAEEALQAERTKRAEEKRKADAEQLAAAQQSQIEAALAFDRELDEAIEADRKEREAIKLEESAVKAESLEESPEFLAIKKETEYFQAKWAETYAGQEAILADQLRRGEITYRTYADKIKQIESAKNKAIAEGVGDTFGAMSQALGAFGGDSKELALAQVTFSLGEAIANLLAVAEANPLNAVTFGGAGIAQYIAGVGRIVSVIGQAKNILNGTKFADGVIGLDGPGTATSDSIPARLSRGESVMTAKATAAFAPQLAEMELAVGNKPNYQLKRYYATGVIGAGTNTVRQSEQDLSRLIQEAVRGVASIPVVVSAGRVRDKVREVEVIDREGDL